MNAHNSGTEQERIEALFSSGRITREQADRLLEALRAGDEAEQEIDRLRDGLTPQPASGTQGPPAAAGEEKSGQQQSRQEEDRPHPVPAAPGQAPASWLEINTFAGDIDVKADAGLSEPVVERGNLELTADGARIRTSEDGEAHFMDRLLEGFSNSKIKVRIPAAWGVRFDVKGGDIDIEGPVAAVTGHLAAGDLEISDTRAVDVTVIAGEAEVGLRADSGEHRVRVRVGEAEVRLLPGSCLDVSTNVSIGSVKARDLNQVSEGVGMKASGLIDNGGNGRGTLALEVVTGEAELKVIPR